MGTGFAWDPPYILAPPLPSGGFIYLPASPLCWPLHCGSVPLGAFLRAPSIPLATLVKPGRAHSGTGISTGCASTTPLGLALAPDLPWEDYPSPGTLGLPAEGFLTPLSLLMPTFSLEPGPRRFAPPLRSRLDAPLPLLQSRSPRLRRLT